MLGLAAEFEFEAFVRLAGDAAAAPTAAARQVVARSSVRAFERHERFLDRLAELGADPVGAMAPFAGVVQDFELRTTSTTWAERLLKAYIGYGVADDFLRLLAQGADGTTRDLLLGSLGDPEHAELVLAELRGADEVTSARLALWGRRLVGDALAVVQGVVARQPALGRLLAAGVPGEGDVVQRAFGALTAEHTRRMDGLGLTA